MFVDRRSHTRTPLFIIHKHAHQDPIIRQVLTDLQENPAAGRQALADPGVAAKIEKLIAAGVLRTG